MSDTLLGVLSHTFEETGLADHVTQVFVDEGVPRDDMSLTILLGEADCILW